MNSPRCSAAQNGCTISGSWALTNRAIHVLPTLKRRAGHRPRSTTPGDARARVDRRSDSPCGLASAPTDAHPIKRVGRSCQ
jgi:hypothetical protein